MLKTGIALLSLVFISSSWGGWEREQFLDLGYRAFEPLGDEQPQDSFLEDANSAIIKIELNGKSEFSNSIFKYDIETRYDASFHERNFFNLKDLWLEHEYPLLNLTVGQKTYNLKKFEGPDLLDTLNPIVLDSSLIDPSKKGLPFAGFNFEVSGHEIRFEWLPIFVGNTFPTEKSRIGSVTDYSERYFDGVTETDKDAADRYFFSWKTYWDLIEGLETSFNFVRQIDALNPKLTLENNEIIFNYFEYKQTSFDWVIPFESWVFKGAMVRKEYDDKSLEFTKAKLEGFDSAALGAEVPFYFWEGLETTIFLEYTKIISSGEVPHEEQSLMQNDVFIGLRQALPGFRSPELTLGLLRDQEFSEEEIFSVQFEMRVFKASKGYLEAVRVSSDPKARTNQLNLNTLSLYENYDYLKLGIKSYF